MTPDDTARVLHTLRADLLRTRLTDRDAGRPWDWETYLKVCALIDQRIWNISTAADFHHRVTQEAS